MSTPVPDFSSALAHHPGGRQHRFMESADINAVFRKVFGPLRANIRRGLSIEGQVYAFEMDGCIPGQLLGAAWLPPGSLGVDDTATLADAARRRALFNRLLAEQRPEALFGYACERSTVLGQATLYVEVVSVDGCHAAEYPVTTGQGWHRRELTPAPHRRVSHATPA